MSVVYLGSDLQTLARRLADALLAHERDGDFFAPVTIVVPNRYLRKWLRLWLARQTGISINLRFREVDEALWDMLRAVDPRPHASAPEPLDLNTERLLVLSVLLEDREPGLAVMRKYMQLQAPPLPRLACRRAWHLADRLGGLLAEYEYHRQETIIQPWLRGQAGLREGSSHPVLERAQRTLFANLVDPQDGKRARLRRLSGRAFRTLPEYALEVMALPDVHKPGETVHCFGLTQLTALHAQVLGWLGQSFDVRLYHPNVIASRLHGESAANALRGLAPALNEPDDADPGRELLRTWGVAGSASLHQVTNIIETGAFGIDMLEPSTAPAPRRAKEKTVLQRLRDQLLGAPRSGAAMLTQDTSVQIVSCPGLVREVGTVHNSILENMRRDPALRQTDFAILVTDMPRYRPILEAVFERPPRRLDYNLVDFSAAGLSTMGQALLAMLDLALESFTRSRVFAVLLNPCFLARLGVERAQALTWLEWAATLGIYQGWDAGEKEEQGYARSPFYAWRLALQRLRLGRYMEVADDNGAAPAPRFGHVIPFADIHCTDREHLDAFCRAVESLLPALANLRRLSGSGQRWATVLQRLVHDFLDVPADRLEEEQVRNEILAALERLALWDHIAAPPSRASAEGAAQGLPLALVREYVQTQLEGLAGSRGEYLTGGVTIAALEPMRPVPFPVIYVIGLDAESFPGSNALSSFDLRGTQREPGDIRPAEENMYLLLEALVAAQQKIYLLYNNYDVTRDQTLLPSVPVQQLQRYLGTHVVRVAFSAVTMPAHGDDDAFFDEGLQPPYQDVLVQHQVADRFAALAVAAKGKRLALDLNQQAELQQEADTLKVDFTVVPDPPPAMAAPVTVSVAELRRYLQFPALEGLRRHLRIDDDADELIEDDEPLITPDDAARQMVRQTLHQLLRHAMLGEPLKALAEWREHFGAVFADGRLRSRVPEDAFGAIDEAALRRELEERIHGRGGLEAFLRARATMMTCGPALLGESITPVGAKMRFPALRLTGAAGPEVRVVGSTPFAWFSRVTFEILVITAASKINVGELCQPMLEPLLLYLALLANPEPNVKAIAARDWLSRRHFLLHVACPDGVRTCVHRLGLINPDEAQRYLGELTRDFLDPTQLDLLPFALLTSGPELRRIYDERNPTPVSAVDYVQILQEKLAQERENPYAKTLHIPRVVEMARATVPADALAKVQRRFRLLDRGPAQLRWHGRRPPPVTAGPMRGSSS